MARFELKLPKMGESVAEATITSWLKEVGDTIELDEAIIEIATDKVDSEVPSEVEGVLVEKLFEVDAVVAVGQTLAIIETSSNGAATEAKVEEFKNVEPVTEEVPVTVQETAQTIENAIPKIESSPTGKFYSPLVKNIAHKEGISLDELEAVNGTGKEGRVTKNDILSYIENRSTAPKPEVKEVSEQPVQKPAIKVAPVSVNGGDEVIEMTRMGKLVAHHMVASTQTSAHVQSFIEIDVTNIVKWRDKVKDAYLKREGEKITYTPIFMQAVE